MDSKESDRNSPGLPLLTPVRSAMHRVEDLTKRFKQRKIIYGNPRNPSSTNESINKDATETKDKGYIQKKGDVSCWTVYC